jgi:hypothetical protein
VSYQKHSRTAAAGEVCEKQEETAVFAPERKEFRGSGEREREREREREKVSFINENTPRAPTGPKNTRKPARLAILK